jgi:hypothetical protein
VNEYILREPRRNQRPAIIVDFLTWVDSTPHGHGWHLLAEEAADPLGPTLVPFVNMIVLGDAVGHVEGEEDEVYHDEEERPERDSDRRVKNE